MSAVHIGSSGTVREEDVAAGIFRFGMIILRPIPQIMYVHIILMYYSVFMAPEIAVNPPWRNLFTKPGFSERVSVIAVDEAHCIYE